VLIIFTVTAFEKQTNKQTNRNKSIIINGVCSRNDSRPPAARREQQEGNTTTSHLLREIRSSRLSSMILSRTQHCPTDDHLVSFVAVHEHLPPRKKPMRDPSITGVEKIARVSKKLRECRKNCACVSTILTLSDGRKLLDGWCFWGNWTLPVRLRWVLKAFEASLMVKNELSKWVSKTLRLRVEEIAPPRSTIRILRGSKLHADRMCFWGNWIFSDRLTWFIMPPEAFMMVK